MLWPPGAATVTEGVKHGDASLHLVPRTAGAVEVLIQYTLKGVDVFVADSAPIEISAPNNINHGPPERPWDDDVRDVLHAVSAGLVLVGVDDTGRVCEVHVPGDRLGVERDPQRTLPTHHPSAWQ